MGRKAVEKGAVVVARLTKPGMHFVGGVDGLALQVLPSGGRSWILRMMVGGKRRHMGLGGYPDVPLTHAREKARAARAKVEQGIDPINEARLNQSLLRASQAACVTFEECTTRYIESQSGKWSNPKSPQQWQNTLATYAHPVMGDLMVRDVELPHVMAALQPIWRTKTETASRLRGRIEAVLDWATVSGFRDGLNPARWKGHLDKLLPAPSKVSNSGHHPALPVSEIGAFMARLRSVDGMGALALEFAILTAVRSGEVRGATWSEIDLNSEVWTIPGERMKAQKGQKAPKPHRVPLSGAAMTLLSKAPRMAESELVFPSARGRMLSDATLSAAIKRLNASDNGVWADPADGRPIVPHGFRSTFRDWCSENTNYPHEMAEMALAHAVGDKVEAAYRRGDLFEKRRRMMADWARYCSILVPMGEVFPINRANYG
jgi:integrase